MSGWGELRYILLFLSSILLVVWQHFGMSVRLDVEPHTTEDHTPVIHSDAINGGISETTLSFEGALVTFDCHIIRSDTFAFCGTSIPLVTPGMAGIDLAAYDKMEIDLDFDSESSDTLLIYMMNSEESATGEIVLRSNLRAAAPQQGRNIFALPTNQFFVPSWWLFQNSHTGSGSAPDISNVTSLQITTGDNTLERRVKVTVHRISFHGKWIAADDLYLALLIAWLLMVSIHILSNMKVLSEQYRETRRINVELLELNRFLSIQKDQYETMAKHDKLTGVLNRAGVRDILSRVLREYKSAAAPCTLVMIDIDHFKKINDDNGHDVGDQALKKLASYIDKHTRDEDIFARWGGEEFILICPRTTLVAASNLAETLRKKIENAKIIETTPITCSFGVATLKNESIKDWFKRADAALYEAKSAGRNCVITKA